MNLEAYQQVLNELKGYSARLVAVSKTKPIESIETFYGQGQRIFGESKVQELAAKEEVLPKDIEWHMIGHLQRNKVKYMAPFVTLVHGVDSERLLNEIDKQAKKNNRIIRVLLQMHIAEEQTKFGLNKNELEQLLNNFMAREEQHVQICGLMGMATNTDNTNQVAKEFAGLKTLFDQLKSTTFSGDEHFKEISMGMSGDYKIALDQGSTLVRIGSKLFGARNYT
ncbi:MAG: YggS family pyridoxal phosphate-dependent enzyme [Bacteroidia bacterium]